MNKFLVVVNGKQHTAFACKAHTAVSDVIEGFYDKLRGAQVSWLDQGQIHKVVCPVCGHRFYRFFDDTKCPLSRRPEYHPVEVSQ